MMRAAGPADPQICRSRRRDRSVASDDHPSGRSAMRSLVPLTLVILVVTSPAHARPATRPSTRPIEVAVRTGRPFDAGAKEPPKRGSMPQYHAYGTSLEVGVLRPGEDVL